MSEPFAPVDVFGALKKILAPHAKTFAVAHDEPGRYTLETKAHVYKGRPIMFASIRTGKRYVSYHLMPVYMNEALKRKISPALKKRMQGKACFNFAAVDKGLIAELKRLTDEGRTCFIEVGRTLERKG